MKILSTLRQPFRTTYEQILRPAEGTVIEWRAVRALFREIGTTEWQANGDLLVVFNEHSLVLRPPPGRDVEGPDELLELRRFIEDSEKELSDLGSLEPEAPVDSPRVT